MAEAVRRQLSLRARMVLLSTLVVTAVLLVAGVVLGLALRDALLDDLERAAAIRAREVATLASEGALPSPVPIEDADEALVQVVIADRVVAASGNIAGAPPLSVPRPPLGRTAVSHARELPVEDDEGDRFVLAATSVAAPGGPLTVFVAASTEDVGDTIAEAAGLAVVSLPVLVLLLGAAMWVLIGRTLAPVERIRAEAAAISGRDLHRRVPEPDREDEVGRLARTLNAMLARLEDGLERQRRFVADAAHELRTPIASIRTELETARSSPRRIDWEATADDVLAEMVRLQRLTEQLLLLARADAGRLELHRRPVDLDDLVHTLVAERRRAEEVTFDTSEVRPAQLHGDPVLLEQLVRNLLENAGHHAAGRVLIGVHQDDATTRLTVEDDGPGIPPEHRQRVFARFTRLDDSRTRERGGTGLGLAIGADIARAHGGAVTAVEGGLGGARFEVSLPTG